MKDGLSEGWFVAIIGIVITLLLGGLALKAYNEAHDGKKCARWEPTGTFTTYCYNGNHCETTPDEECVEWVPAPEELE